jgi:PLP dependent protein
MTNIEHNLQIVQRRIADAATHAGRDPRDVTLVAVSKTFPAEAILAAYTLGVRHFGENRVEEAATKIPAVNSQTQGITWHLIGHLQSRKAKDAVALFDMVQSVDTVALAERLNDRATARGKTIPILLEVNVSSEATKYGFSFASRESFFANVREILALPNLDPQGLMTVAPIAENPEDARPHFQALRELRDELRTRFADHTWQHLSMGMTDDFESAIAEGATMVRIGRAIFGTRA